MKKPSWENQKSGLIVLYLYQYRFVLLSAFLFSLCATALNLLTPQVIRVTVDSIIGNEALGLPSWLTDLVFQNGSQPVTSLFIASIFVLLISLLSALFSYLSRMRIAQSSETFVKSLRDRLFDHIQKLPYLWHSQNQTGDIVQRCTSDVEVIHKFISNQLLEVFRIGFLIALSLSVMFSMNVEIAWIAALFIPIVMLYSGLFYFKIAHQFRKADEAEGELSSVVQENLTGVRVVRAFGRERYEIERFDEKNNNFANLWIRLGRIMSAYWGIGDLITGLQILFVISFGVVKAVDGAISLGQFLAFISYNSMLIWPVRGLGRILSEMSKSGVSVERVMHILNEAEQADRTDISEPPMNGDISFDIRRFVYDGNKSALQEIRFTIPSGTTFAILGGTGSGKSTLIHLLDRLYELPADDGSISIGGVDIRQIKLSYLRKNIGIVLQEPFLFSRTVEENIRSANRGATMEEIRNAASIAHIDQSIAQFPKGYETIIGERGVTLSGGQMQRVAIARMLMQKAPIMIFDDSLSAVDTETDARIRSSLKENLGKATVILISHRITTLMQADCILVLDEGKISQLGTHEQLIEQEGIYKSIYEIQMNSDDRILLERG